MPDSVSGSKLLGGSSAAMARVAIAQVFFDIFQYVHIPGMPRYYPNMVTLSPALAPLMLTVAGRSAGGERAEFSGKKSITIDRIRLR